MEKQKLKTDILMEGTVVELQKKQQENSLYDRMHAYGKCFGQAVKDAGKEE